MSGEQKDDGQGVGWFAQWEAVATRYDNLIHQLADPSVLSQTSLLIALNKERVEIEETSQIGRAHV